MVADRAERSRYREYAHFLRVNADRLNMTVAPARLERLREQVDSERNRFLLWEVVWLLIAVISLLPTLMLIAAATGLPLPEAVGARAAAFHHQVAVQDSGGAMLGVVVSVLMFLFAAAVACAPIIIYSRALRELELAHRALHAAEKE